MRNPVFLFHLWAEFLGELITELFDNDYEARE
jgi:hypothetical protein